MEIATNHDLSTKELLQKFPKKQERTVRRGIRYLKENNEILKVKIRGKKGKRLRWIIPEEIGKNIWIRSVPKKFNRKKPRIVNMKVTQRFLSQIITAEKKFYKKQLKISKKEPYDQFVFWHMAMASKCMELNLQLTWAINAGVFSDSEKKLALAYTNRERYEKFLNKIIYNLKVRDKKKFKTISSTVYNLLTHSSLMEKVFYPNANWQPRELAFPKPKSLH